MADSKKKVSLDIFQESVLPMLEQKHNDTAALQKVIDDTYEIVEANDKGEETVVEFKVVGSKAQPKPAPAPALDESKIAKIVSETVTATIKAMQPQKPAVPANGEIRLSDRYMDGFRPKLYKPVTSFTGDGEERKFKAYRFGCWLLGGVFGMKKYAEWCAKEGVGIQKVDDKDSTIILGKAHAEGVNTTGGVLVPDVLENDIIDLREKYGVARAHMRLRPMARDTATIPRRTGGLTAYFTAEAGSITESTKSWGNVELTSKKLAVLAKYSSEVLEDAIISIADDLASEIVYAFSLKEDQCAFIGDGTSTYGQIVGVKKALTDNWTSTTTTSAGVVIAAGNTMAEVTDANLCEVMGRLPQYADDGTAAWYCSRVGAMSVMGRLLQASGGTLLSEKAGAIPLAYGGYPIIVSQVMPVTDTNSQIIAVFGSLRKAADFGDRRQTTISISDQAYWANDQVGIRGTERFDIVVHDAGDGTTAGPIIGLRASAS